MNANATLDAKKIDIADDARARLMEAVAHVEAQYPDVDIAARYCDFKDLKLKWVRSKSWIELDVSDYLSEVPADILGEFIGSVLAQIFDGVASDPAGRKVLFPYAVPFKDAFIARHKAVRDDGATEAVRSALGDMGYDRADTVIGAVGMNPDTSTVFDIIILPPDWTEEDAEDIATRYLELKRRFEE